MDARGNGTDDGCIAVRSEVVVNVDGVDEDAWVDLLDVLLKLKHSW
jgi:hypothetical protein